jgi:glycosyltransferase involved in cell wall biosynthesis
MISRLKKVDFIHAHWLFPQGLIAVMVKLLTGTKTVITTHGGDVAILNKTFQARILRPALKKADLLTFVSARNLYFVAEKFGNYIIRKSSILPMGISIPKEYPPGNPNKLLFIGRLVKIKGIDFLIKGLAIALKENPNLELDILGDGPLYSELRALAKQLHIENNIQFRGFLVGKEKDSHLKEAAALLISSIIDEHGYEEGLPVAALEGLAYGKIVMATKTGSMPEVIHHKINGLLIPPGDSKAIAESLSTLSKEKTAADLMRQNARKTAEFYSWENIGAKFFELVRNLKQ